MITGGMGKETMNIIAIQQNVHTWCLIKLDQGQKEMGLQTPEKLRVDRWSFDHIIEVKAMK